MSAVGLLYVGAVLFLNGLMLLSRIDIKSAGVFNLFIGAMQVITPFYMIFTSGGDAWTIFQASGIFLFGLTYLYVGITNLLGLDASGIGWYSLWVAVLAVGYAAINFLHFHDEKFGIIWLMWSFLWTLFFILLALKRNIGAFVGWVTLIQAWVTATIPAFLILIGEWERIGVGVTEAAAGLAVVGYGAAYAFTRRKAPHGVEVSS
ncbi:AmiS/UreI family transporter [Paenibacillus tyrfis]|uniref:AmiS/UreI family transporter n=1 Tax=Paenibacillus tyrfis TaxID=1501230 RepID=UPI000B587CBA|nr:AmiS/UreI family transporter [Paenibacillus tyrfis]